LMLKQVAVLTVLAALSVLVTPVLGCGGNFTGSSGVITSPNYPSNYPNDTECVYVITVTEGRHIRLNFTFFSTEFDADTLYIESESNTEYVTDRILSGSYASDETNELIYTSFTNVLKLTFISDGSDSRGGFSATYEEVEELCNNGDGLATLTDSSGTITSLNYPYYYPWSICGYNITGNPEDTITLTVNHFDVAPSAGSICNFQIHDSLMMLPSEGGLIILCENGTNYVGRTLTFQHFVTVAGLLTHPNSKYTGFEFSYTIGSPDACNCVDDHTVSCEEGTCVCKTGFSGSECETGSAPVLTVTPAQSVYKKGSIATIHCTYVSPNDVEEYAYFFNGVYIGCENCKGDSITNHNLQQSSSGDYTCNAELKWDERTPMSNMVTINVIECNATTYGIDCANTCSCVPANTFDCHDVDGTCTCKPGFYGSNCESETTTTSTTTTTTTTTEPTTTTSTTTTTEPTTTTSTTTTTEPTTTTSTTTTTEPTTTTSTTTTTEPTTTTSTTTTTKPGCSSDFEEVGGECVMWLGKRGKYDQAKDLCQQKNATVLMVKSENFSNALMAWSRPNKAPYRNFWVGLSNLDTGDREKFTWADDSPLADKDWDNWLWPVKFSRSRSCVAAGVNHQAWKRYDCLRKAVYIVCQQQP